MTVIKPYARVVVGHKVVSESEGTEILQERTAAGRMVDGTRDRARRAGNWLRSESGRAAVRTGATVAAAGAGVAATVWGISKLAALSAAAAATADDQRFLRPTTAPVRRLKQFSKRNIRNELQGERELVLGEVHFSRFAGRHIEIFDGVTINVTLLLRPLHAPL